MRYEEERVVLDKHSSFSFRHRGDTGARASAPASHHVLEVATALLAHARTSTDISICAVPPSLPQQQKHAGESAAAALHPAGRRQAAHACPAQPCGDSRPHPGCMAGQEKEDWTGRYEERVSACSPPTPLALPTTLRWRERRTPPCVCAHRPRTAHASTSRPPGLRPGCLASNAGH